MRLIINIIYIFFLMTNDKLLLFFFSYICILISIPNDECFPLIVLKDVSIERSTNVSFDKFNISDWEKKRGGKSMVTFENIGQCIYI